MARRSLNHLTEVGIRAAIKGTVKAGKAARIADGGSLYLAIGPNGSASWLFFASRMETAAAGGRVQKRREIGLGPFPATSLAQARAKAVQMRSMVADGIDPLKEREAERRARMAKGVTFGEAVARYLDGFEAHGVKYPGRATGFSNAKHAWQWRQTLGPQFCARIHDKPVADVDRDDVLAILSDRWTATPETASRLRGRLETVLDFATAHGWRPEIPNPARWKGNLDGLLSRRKREMSHYRAVAFLDVPALMERLRCGEGIAALALRFQILTAARSGEVRFAAWDEIDFEAREWRIPAHRMKARKPHTVPLSDPALAILRDLHAARHGNLIFPGARPAMPLSDMALSAVMRRLDIDAVPHGFRSSFSDWAHETTQFSGEVIEISLAHIVGSAVARAYRRGDMRQKRRALMDAWADHCTGNSRANVISLRA